MQIIGRIDGQDVGQITITGPGGLTARILTWGARLAELWVPDRAGECADIVLGHDTAADWQATPAYFGATCGRYANRIAGGQFVLDGRRVTLDRNEGANHLHGGQAGFDRKHWSVDDHGPAHVTLAATSPDGEMGYPGAMAMTCRYAFDAAGHFLIDMRATTDAPTVVNMVNHAYFNMAGQGAGDVLGNEVQIFADRYLPVDDELIPTGEQALLAKTPFDFTAKRAIGALMPNRMGYDHNFCLSAPPDPPPDPLTGGLRPVAIARDPASGRQMAVWANQPGVQFYTGAYLPAGLRGKQGASYGPYAGFALETQVWPDTPNRPDFPPARLDPGQTYRHRMLFDLTPDQTLEP